MSGPSKVPPPSLRRSLSRGSTVGQPSPTLSQKSGHMFFSVLASKRMAKQFASKVCARRAAGSGTQATSSSHVNMEPSYRMEPGAKFDENRVRAALLDIVEHRMKCFHYSPRHSVTMCRILAEEIKERIKEMNFDRYKIVCVVNIGEVNRQDLSVTSRCLWDTNFDKSCTYNWMGGGVFCTATVYGLYHD